MAYVHLHGHIGREPEVKHLGETLVCTFPLADRAWLRPRGEEREAAGQWYRVELWARQAEALGPLLGKGKEVMVHGQLEIVRFARADGSEGVQPTVRRATVQLVGRKGDGGPGEQAI